MQPIYSLQIAFSIALLYDLIVSGYNPISIIFLLFSMGLAAYNLLCELNAINLVDKYGNK